MPHSTMLLPCLQCYSLLMIKEKQFADKCLLCVFFLLSLHPLHPRSSAVSVVFVFNDLLNDVAPVSPILLPVDVKRKKGEKGIC